MQVRAHVPFVQPVAYKCSRKQWSQAHYPPRLYRLGHRTSPACNLGLKDDAIQGLRAQPAQVVVYHGAKRATTVAQLAGADVVLTTYSIIESEHRRHMMPGKVTCRYCKHKFYTDRLRLHLKCASKIKLFEVSWIGKCSFTIDTHIMKSNPEGISSRSKTFNVVRSHCHHLQRKGAGCYESFHGRR